MEAGARWTMPAVNEPASRSLCFYSGDSLQADGNMISSQTSFELKAGMELTFENGPSESHLLLLQGNPINEPVVQYGPFVMNTETEIRQAISDYRATQFGGWPWPRPDPVNPRSRGRFAKYADGTEETP
jgi:redox-sensitive bicupin YhaK (pirin superfamily)